MDDKENFIVNEEEQNVPVNPQENDFSPERQNESLITENTENKEIRKEISPRNKEEKPETPTGGNMDESEGFDPNIVPAV